MHEREDKRKRVSVYVPPLEMMINGQPNVSIQSQRQVGYPCRISTSIQLTQLLNGSLTPKRVYERKAERKRWAHPDTNLYGPKKSVSGSSLPTG